MATDAAIAPWALRQAKASALAAEVGLPDKLKPKIDPATAGRLANLTALEKQMGRIRELYRQGTGVAGRKSDVLGKRGSVSVALGGRRIHHTTMTRLNTIHSQ